MASIIKSDNGVSSGITGIVQSADSSGQLALQTTTSGGTATTAVTIDNTQKVTFANSIGFGSNAGITFNNSSATVNSTLNDYETGTWTPVINRTVTAPTVTYTVQQGNYVKIGRFVYLNCNIAISGVSAQGSGYNCVSGLPFAVNFSNASWYDIGGSVKYNTMFSGVTVDRLSGGGSQGANAVSFLPANTVGTAEVNANIATGNVYLTFTAIYQATF